MPKFDVFLSHNSVDKAWVIQLKEDLQRYGVKVWLDKDEIRPGDLFAKALEEALEDCQAMALIVSPEAMASGWVEKEYYRALSLTNKGQQLIPVILRKAEAPGFAKSYNWVDFRDPGLYPHNVWKLVWGVTGQKPVEVLDLSAPPDPQRHQPPISPSPQPTEAQPQAAPGFRSGGIRAKNIEAEIVTDGVLIEGGDAEIARAALELAQNLQTGGIEVTETLKAKKVTAGFHHIGQGKSD